MPSGVLLFTLHCKDKIISYVYVHCNLLNMGAYMIELANTCCCSCSFIVTIGKSYEDIPVRDVRKNIDFLTKDFC